MALLASYLVNKEDGETLEAFLANKVFCGETGTTLAPDPADVEGFRSYIKTYRECLAVEHAAADSIG